MEAVKEINRRLMARNPVPLDMGPNEAPASYVRPLDRIQCKDGFSVSVQAGQFIYSIPRNNIGPWCQFELGFPSVGDILIAQYAEDPERPTETVYGYVPEEVVEALIQSHGGLCDV